MEKPKVSPWEKVKLMTGKRDRSDSSPPVIRKLRLRGDWSDTGPYARPENEATTGGKLFYKIGNLVEIVRMDSQRYWTSKAAIEWYSNATND